MKVISIFSLQFLFILSLKGQWKSGIGFGAHLAQASYSRKSIPDTSITGTYAGVGGALDYTKYYFLNNDSTNKTYLKRRAFFGLTGGLDYTRYGAVYSEHTPPYNVFDCSINHLTTSFKQQMYFSISQYKLLRYVIFNLNMAESFKFNFISGDSKAIEFYGLKTSSGKSNVTNTSIDLGAGFYFMMTRKLYANIGYVNGLFNILRHNPENYPLKREFYLYLKLVKILY